MYSITVSLKVLIDKSEIPTLIIRHKYSTLPSYFFEEVNFEWYPSSVFDRDQKIYVNLTECCLHLNNKQNI